MISVHNFQEVIYKIGGPKPHKTFMHAHVSYEKYTIPKPTPTLLLAILTYVSRNKIFKSKLLEHTLCILFECLCEGLYCFTHSFHDNTVFRLVVRAVSDWLMKQALTEANYHFK